MLRHRSACATCWGRIKHVQYVTFKTPESMVFRYNIIPILADILSEVVKEKVIRIILATLRVSDVTAIWQKYQNVYPNILTISTTCPNWWCYWLISRVYASSLGVRTCWRSRRRVTSYATTRWPWCSARCPSTWRFSTSASSRTRTWWRTSSTWLRHCRPACKTSGAQLRRLVANRAASFLVSRNI